jgi:hypothetical protein
MRSKRPGTDRLGALSVRQGTPSSTLHWTDRSACLLSFSIPLHVAGRGQGRRQVAFQCGSVRHRFRLTLAVHRCCQAPGWRPRPYSPPMRSLAPAAAGPPSPAASLPSPAVCAADKSADASVGVCVLAAAPDRRSSSRAVYPSHAAAHPAGGAPQPSAASAPIEAVYPSTGLPTAWGAVNPAGGRPFEPGDGAFAAEVSLSVRQLPCLE